MMESAELRDICLTAIDASKVSRGKNKGMLKATCPPMGTDASAAWQALIGYANPYKMSFGQIMLFTDRQRAIYRAIDDALTGSDLHGLDRDRVALERLGAW
jgi:hypothetical protein